MAFDPAYADAIAKIESGGNYGILGPITKSGDRAYGKYQVMGANIPVWTKEILGAPMTPEQFIASPEAQDAVFRGKFSQYEAKYGPEGAAQAWFAGPGGVGKLDRKDQLGTSVEAYGKKFMANVGPVAGPAPVEPFEPQKPLPPQPLNLAQPQAAPQPFQPAPQSPSGPWRPSTPYQDQPIQMAAPLNAPQPLQRQLNLLRAFANIPTPAGFSGFRFS